MAHNILIRCDASKEIGLGHITRCLVIANYFRDEGHKVYFAIRDYSLGKEKIKEQNFDYFSVNKKDFDYNSWINNLLEKLSINIFVGDVRDGLPSRVIIEMKNKKILTIAIDEPSDYAKECDLCFYPPHANIDKSKYKGKVYKGLEYVLLRPEFYEPFEKVENEIPNVLVMIGGTDAFNLTLPVIKQVDKNNEKFKISVILSDKHKDIKQLNKFAETSNHQIKVYNEVKDMSSFLNNIDFAVVAFGTVVYELIYKKIPAIYITNEKFDNEIKLFFEQNKYGLFDSLNFSKIMNQQFKRSYLKNKVLEEIKTFRGRTWT